MFVRVFNYNNQEKVIAFEAHQDYIRSIAVHPTLPYILTASDDMTIKLWDWEKGWKCIMTFEGHTHYVMQVAFNPKDHNTFASASLDKTVKIWSLGASNPNFTLEGHLKGVNCVDYYQGADKPYLVSGADDKTVKIWDYQSKACVQTLEGHTQNVSAACFHPELPIIVSASEDGTVRLWHSNTYRLENTLNYGMERAWALSYVKGNNQMAFGFDEGTITINLGREEPAISMDSTGKIIYAKHNEILGGNVKSNLDETHKDGEKLTISFKDLGSSEIYPQQLQHSPNGRFVVVCGDGEYVIYTALAWRNKSFGRATDFVWALDSNEYAVREPNNTIKLFKSFKEKEIFIRPGYSVDTIFGGALIAVKSREFVCFYDWETGGLVRRVDVVAKNVIWNESDTVAIISDDAFYLLRFRRDLYAAQASRGGFTEEGFEEAFEFICEVNETVKTGCWVGSCFVFSNSVNRLCYVVGETTSIIEHFDYPVYILGFIQKDNRIYLTDKDINITSFSFPQGLVEYQSAILSNDLDTANKILPTLDEEQCNKVAVFLEGRGLLQQAFNISRDREHQFELAMKLENVDKTYELVSQLGGEERWKQVGDLALKKWRFDLVEESFLKAGDYESLLMYYQACGDYDGMMKLGQVAADSQKFNISFMAFMLTGHVDKCVEILLTSERVPEAAFLARTYAPSLINKVVSTWKNDSPSVVSPQEDESAFPDYGYGLIAEEAWKRRVGSVPAQEYLQWKESSGWDIISELKKRYPNGPPSAPVSPPRQPPPSTPTFSASSNLVSPVRSPAQKIPSHTSSPVSKKVQLGNGPEEDDVKGVNEISDTLSHISMEVNTTGTGSVRGDFDDFPTDGQ